MHAHPHIVLGFAGGAVVKNLPAVVGGTVPSLGRDDPSRGKWQTHSSILAWKIPQAEEPSRLKSLGSQRIRSD